MCHRGYVWEDILKKYVLCKKENYINKYVINEYVELKRIKR